MNKQWVVVTGGGSGIGRMLMQKYSRDYHVLTCGRRLAALGPGGNQSGCHRSEQGYHRSG